MLELIIIIFAIVSIYSSIKETALKSQEKININKDSLAKGKKNLNKVKTKKTNRSKIHSKENASSSVSASSEYSNKSSDFEARKKDLKTTSKSPAKKKESPSFESQYNLKDIMLSYEIMSGPKSLRNNRKIR